nr:TetR/AcrR family transcriptional regulator [Rhodococcus sp. HNM0569]
MQAAGKLFCTEGYGSVSTYRIARAARISQATMYHYFAGKHEILSTLLLETVQPSVAFAEHLVTSDAPAPARLWALCAFDTRLLVSGPENLGALYLLPELSDERFAAFHAERTRLRAVYRTLVRACPDVGDAVAQDLADLVFGLVESAILRRRQDLDGVGGTSIDDGFATRTADAALRVVGLGPAAGMEAARAGQALAAAAPS